MSGSGGRRRRVAADHAQPTVHWPRGRPPGRRPPRCHPARRRGKKTASPAQSRRAQARVNVHRRRPSLQPPAKLVVNNARFRRRRRRREKEHARPVKSRAPGTVAVSADGNTRTRSTLTRSFRVDYSFFFAVYFPSFRPTAITVSAPGPKHPSTFRHYPRSCATDPTAHSATRARARAINLSRAAVCQIYRSRRIEIPGKLLPRRVFGELTTHYIYIYTYR